MPKRSKTKRHDIFKIGKWYHFRDTLLGIRVEEKLNTDDWTTACQEADRIIRTYDPKSIKSQRLTVEDVHPEFVKYLNDRKDGKLGPKKLIRQSTYREYIDKFNNHLLEHFRYIPLQAIDETLWNNYTATKQGVALRNHAKTFGHFLRWSMKKGYIQRLPDLVVPEWKKREGLALTDDEVKALLKFSNRNLTLFVLMYLTMAMRRGEIIKLAWADVHFDARAVYVDESTAKTKKRRVVPISEIVLPILKERRAEAPKAIWVFTNVRHPNRHMSVDGLKGSWLRCRKKAMVSLLSQAKTLEERELITKRMTSATPHDLRRTWKSRAHLRTDLTKTQLEKFAGADIEVQKKEYVVMEAESLRAAAEVVKVPGLKSIINSKNQSTIGRGNTGEKPGRSKR